MGLKDGTLIRSSPSLAMGVACHIDVPPIPTVYCEELEHIDRKSQQVKPTCPSFLPLPFWQKVSNGWYI